MTEGARQAAGAREFMFDFLGIGGWEILLVLVVALLVMGPQKIPEIARKAGKVMRAVKKTGSDLMAEVNREIEIEEKAAVTAPGKSLPEQLDKSLNADLTAGITEVKDTLKL
jgi:Tat protein translocase TatB subunit